jgi:TDG/mug DNA glycosylase family protein
MSPILPDYLAMGLRAVFCGTAVATASRDRGGYYAGPGNEFWGYLHDSGLVPVPLGPGTDHRVLDFALGLTDLVKSVAASSDRGLVGYDVPGFIAKMNMYQPGWIAFHGKTAAKAVSGFLGFGSDVWLGEQPWAVAGRPVYVLPSASASNRDPGRLEGKGSRLEWFEAFAEVVPVKPQASRG